MHQPVPTRSMAANDSDIRGVLARRVRELRHLQNLSQEALADRAGLHRTFVGAIERSERNISLDNIAKIARALDVEPADLLRGASV